MIGVFTIPVGDLMQALQEERQRETQQIVDINIELLKILASIKGESSHINPKSYSIQYQSFDEGESELIRESVNNSNYDSFLASQ